MPTYLLALSHSGQHERTIVCTLLLCVGPIEGCSAVLAVRTVDAAAVAFGAWFVLSPAEKKQVQKQKLRGCWFRADDDTASSLQEVLKAPHQQSCSPRGWHSPVP